MGTITQLNRGIPDLLPMRDRSLGMHISEVIHDLCIIQGHYKDNPLPSMTRLQLGSTFEYALALRYEQESPNRYIQPGELSKDGLCGTPDLLDLSDWSIHEIKLTWLSSSHEPSSVKFWKYWVQLMCYCYMIETSIGILHVCFINGDYRDERDPVYTSWRHEFSSRELKENWHMITQNAELMRQNRKVTG